MNNQAICVEKLGKRYRIGAARERNRTFREAITDMIASPWRSMRNAQGELKTEAQRNSDHIWALKDVSFEVRHGEVLGIIGRNGSGKSTLLKILSRITEPTEGRVVLRGRVGSLLEVGTGFHSELTGEENIYLSGTILGMTSREISNKFDEIVAFAEIKKFMNTPVKYYSSGMYMRLAFAVAAHLEPEILLIDEVLAVGDAEFQKKCLGKMGDVARAGRTVLFVSHNMAAVQSLCKNALQLESGRISATGNPETVISHYLSKIEQLKCVATWPESAAPGNDEIKLTSVRVFSEAGDFSGYYRSSGIIYIEMEFIAHAFHPALCIGFDLMFSNGETVLRSYQTDPDPDNWPKLKSGKNTWQCTIPSGLLNAGLYFVCPRIGMHNMYWIINMDAVAQFEVALDHGVSPFWLNLDGHNRPGVIAPILSWQVFD